MYKNKDEKEAEVQWKTTCTIIETEDKKAALKFAITLGMVHIVCQALLDEDDVLVQAYYRDKAAGTETLVGERTYRSKMMDTVKGKDILIFTIPLGFLKIICLANVPDEDDENQYAPVYVKFKFFDQPLQRRQDKPVEASA